MSGLLERGCSIIVDATSFLRSMQFRSLDSVTDATKNGKMDGNAAISVFGYCDTSSENLPDCVVTFGFGVYGRFPNSDTCDRFASVLLFMSKDG